MAARTDPDWEPIMKKSRAIVTDQGGRTCHAAIIARELGIPAIVGCGNATSKIADGAQVTVDCAEGEEGRVYDGIEVRSRLRPGRRDTSPGADRANGAPGDSRSLLVPRRTLRSSRRPWTPFQAPRPRSS